MLAGGLNSMHFWDVGRFVVRFRAGVALAALAATMSTGANAQDSAGQPSITTAPAKFLVAAFDVTGVTILESAAIERAVYPFLGPDRSFDDVEAARKAVQDAYAAKGYESVQVDIPPQPGDIFAEGVVQLRVTEAPVGEVRIAGAKYHSNDLVRRQMAALEPGKPLNLKTLQADLSDANRFPDRTIIPSFKSGKIPGTVDVELKVKDSLPLHGSIEINNDHSPSTEPLRVTASLRYTNLWQRGHTISASYIVAPQNRKQTEVISGAYNAPLLGTPWTMVLYGYKSNSNIAALGGSNVLGNGYQIGMRAMYRLPAEKTYQSLSFGIDYKNFNQNIFVAGQQASMAPIEYAPLSVGYSLSAADDNETFDLTLGATLGLRIFKKFRCFNTDPNVLPADCPLFDQFKNKDLDASENFAHFNLDLNYTRVLPKDFIGAIRVSAQLADSHLVTNEQFAAGGLTSVRGYFQSEAVGDEGISSSFELRSPSLAPYLPAFVGELRLFGFADLGRVRIKRVLPDQQSYFDLAGVGGGVRVRLFDRISGEFSVGVPLINGPSTPRGDLRSLFSAKGEF
jgi:hemolysin activation/secretion protein